MKTPRALAALAYAALLLCGCATRLVDRNAPKVVENNEIAPYATYQECLLLEQGERLDFRFESSEPLHFDLRYRDAGATVLPLVRDGTREFASIYPVPATRAYCLAWEAGAAGARLDYRFTVHPATP